MKKTLLSLAFAGVAALGAPAQAASIDFEDLVLGTVYNVGGSLATNGITVTPKDFTFSNGTTFGGGFALVENLGNAGGSGQDLQVNNILLDFALGNVTDLSFAFGEFGGNLNIDVNGDFRNFQDFADIDGLTIGGALVSVVNGFGNDQGMVSLAGPISSFAIGGQELYIDDLRATAVIPLPAGVALLGGGLMLLAGVGRRRT